MINKNRNKVEVETETRDLSNWNFRDISKSSICTKPIGVVKIDGDEFVFSHEDLFKIFQPYIDVDEKSIEMIKDPKINTGEVKNYKTPFIEKIKKKFQIEGLTYLKWKEQFQNEEAMKQDKWVKSLMIKPNDWLNKQIK